MKDIGWKPSPEHTLGMSEDEYIGATNLAKIRIAKDVLKALSLKGADDLTMRGVIAKLSTMEIELQARMRHIT